MAANSPHALLLLFGALLLAAYASSVVAADSKMVIVHAATAAGGARASETAVWRQRRLEDGVAPEFPSAAVGGGGVANTVFHPDRQVCVRYCAGKGPGDTYTQKRGCTYMNMCPH